VDDRLTHLDDAGRARMVDVTGKPVTARTACAEAHVALSAEVAARLFAGDLPKGDALGVVRVAAIMGAKKTSDLIPLCHPLPLAAVTAEVERTDEGARIVVNVAVEATTGVEMEALTGAAVGAVTLYDMVKALDKGVTIGPVRLLTKTGGKSGDWSR
jgi:cyclic pyranopterin phosphate synthase